MSKPLLLLTFSNDQFKMDLYGGYEYGKENIYWQLPFLMEKYTMSTTVLLILLTKFFEVVSYAK
jgi:hypothetical protein